MKLEFTMNYAEAAHLQFVLRAAYRALPDEFPNSEDQRLFLKQLSSTVGSLMVIEAPSEAGNDIPY